MEHYRTMRSILFALAALLVVAGASTGNAATSMSCVSAYMGIKPYIFVPERAPKAKVAQLLVYGATVIMVRGSYDQCFGLCWEAGERWGWYSRNTAINPFLSEGKKTASRLALGMATRWEIAKTAEVKMTAGPTSPPQMFQRWGMTCCKRV